MEAAKEKTLKPDIDEVYPKIFISSAGPARDLDVLQERNITHIVQVAKLLKPMFEEKFKYLEIDLNDSPDEDAYEHFQEAAQFIDDALSGGGSVLVHCGAGVSRSSTMVIAYFILQKKS